VYSTNYVKQSIIYVYQYIISSVQFIKSTKYLIKKGRKTMEKFRIEGLKNDVFINDMRCTKAVSDERFNKCYASRIMMYEKTLLARQNAIK